MTHKKMYIIIALAVVLVGWFLWSWLSVRSLEQPAYEVTATYDGYEIRTYEPYIVAQATVSNVSSMSEAASAAFPIIAGYIFGGNTRAESIAMTAPVQTAAGVSEKIAMTVPVNTTADSIEDGSYVVSFVMPSKFTLETLPKPNDARVNLVAKPSVRVASKRFSWWPMEKRIERLTQEFKNQLKKDGVKTMGSVTLSRFNPPWTLPFMLRNELQIEVQ